MAIDSKDKLLLKRFGDRVQEWRITETEWSQEETGFQCGLSQRYISEIECGKKNITILTLGSIAKGFGISATKFLEFKKLDGNAF